MQQEKLRTHLLHPRATVHACMKPHGEARPTSRGAPSPKCGQAALPIAATTLPATATRVHRSHHVHSRLPSPPATESRRMPSSGTGTGVEGGPRPRTQRLELPAQSPQGPPLLQLPRLTPPPRHWPNGAPARTRTRIRGVGAPPRGCARNPCGAHYQRSTSAVGLRPCTLRIC